MDRAEHLEWAKNRALEYVRINDLKNAWASMASDLGKHIGIQLGMMMLMSGHLSTSNEMKEFIIGFN